MIADRREARILDRLRAEGTSSVRELAQDLAVSTATVRRDLQRLERSGALRRVRGGAAPCAVDPYAMPAWPSARRPPAPGVPAAAVVAAKEAMAARAVELVEDGDVLLLDIGSTTVALARRLHGRRVTVLTSSLAVLDELREDERVELVVLGGVVRRTYLSLVGELTEQALHRVRAHRLFLGASGVTPAGDVMDSTLVEVPVKRAMVAAADEVVLLADASKLPGTGVVAVCAATDLDVVVTTEGADPATVRVLEEAGVRVLTA